MLDLLIRRATYPDFHTNSLLQGDVGIKDGRIVTVRPIKTGSIQGETAIREEVSNQRGSAAQREAAIRKEAGIRAGAVTQEDASAQIDAQGCILSPGFIDIHMHEENFAEEGKAYEIAELMLRMGVTTCLGGNCGLQNQKTREFRQVIEELGGSPVNYMLMAGYNTARTKKGLTHRAAASPTLIQELSQEMKQELADGAYGISFGLEYDPGITFEEVVQILENQEVKNLFVSMHYREDSTGSLSAIDEMIRIARATDTRFQISHLASCSAMGQMKEALKRINHAISENPRLSYDTYPYNAFSTHIGSEVFDDGCLKNWGKDYHDIMLTDKPFQNQFCDKQLFERARRDYPDMLAVAFVMNEEEIGEALANPNGMIASDGIISHGSGHPRAAGTFPRVLGKYVREEKRLSMMDALKKMTLLPARRLELHKKGEIREGFDADLTIFDPQLIKDGATFESLSIPPTGIRQVLIGGRTALQSGVLMDDRLGRFLPSSFFSYS